MKELPQAFAYVIPLPAWLVSRVVESGRTVLVKFIGQPSQRTRLRPGTLILLYQSGGSKTIIGEAAITRINYGSAEELLAKYGGRLILDEAELDNYMERFAGRSEKHLIALEVGAPTTYEKPLLWKGHMTMRGKYLENDEYLTLRKA